MFGYIRITHGISVKQFFKKIWHIYDRRKYTFDNVNKAVVQENFKYGKKNHFIYY